jgi:hypothetical protein
MDYEALRKEANGIKNETEAGGNSAERVGNMLQNLVAMGQGIDKQVQTNKQNIDNETIARQMLYKGDLGNFTDVKSGDFVVELLLRINALGGEFGQYTFEIGRGGAGSKQIVVYANVGSKKKITVSGCLKAETLNGTGTIDSVTSTYTNVVECDVTIKKWVYLSVRVNDLYYEYMEDDYSFDETAEQRGNESYSREQMLGILSSVKENIFAEVRAMIDNINK